MQIIEQTTEFHIEEPTAIAIGKFDGIHRGHKEIFSNLFQAKKEGLKTAVFTFDPSPETFFSKKQIPELTTREEKRKLFEKMQIDYLVEYPFAQATADVLPRDYVTDFLLHKMNGKLIVAGTDVSFGKGGKGNEALLKSMAKEYHFRLVIIDKILRGQKEISSSYVREEVTNGNMELVEELLGTPYFISGIVEDGKKLGRTLGIPTANIYPSKEKLLPPNGVYFCNVFCEGITYQGVTNIGCRPTVQDGDRMSVETYLLDFDGDLYGRELVVELLHFSRKEERFESVSDLSFCVKNDIRQAREYFAVD